MQGRNSTVGKEVGGFTASFYRTSSLDVRSPMTLPRDMPGALPLGIGRMETLFDKAWVILSIVAGMGVLGVLHCVASSINNHHKVHDLRVRVNELRNQQIHKLKQTNLDYADFDVVDQPAKKAA